MKILLPWPDKRVFPNYRQSHHWKAYTDARRKQRADACTLATVSIPLRDKREIAAREGKIELQVTFYPPDRRHRDDDGLVGAFKSARDGIADALGIDDRRFSCRYLFADPEKPGRIEVEIGSCQSRQDDSLDIAGMSPLSGEVA